MRCPNCGGELSRQASGDEITWPCPSCGGRAVGMGVLRRVIPRADANRIWGAALELPAGSGRKCCVCGRTMTLVPAGPSGGDPFVDVCRGCQFVWFDPSELDALPSVPKPVREVVPQEALDAVARVEARRIAEDFRTRYPQSDLPSPEAIPAILGLPIEEEATIVSRLPLVTWAAAFAMTMAAILQLAKPGLIEEWGFVASDPFRRGGITALTAFFLHSGVFHFVSNLWFLLSFGDNVEEFLGRFNFALLLFVAGLTGAIAHGVLGDSSRPLVGASGAISGVIVFYAMKFPQAKLRYFRLLSGWLTMPASLAVGFWALSQFLGARDQISGSSDVSFLAHIGGALVGAWFWFLWRKD